MNKDSSNYETFNDERAKSPFRGTYGFLFISVLILLPGFIIYVIVTQSQISSLNSQLSTLSSEVASMSTAALQAQITQLNTTVNNTNTKLAALQGQISGFDSEFSDLNDTIHDVQATLLLVNYTAGNATANVSQVVANLTTLNSTLTNSIANLSNTLTGAIANVNETAQSLNNDTKTAVDVIQAELAQQSINYWSGNPSNTNLTVNFTNVNTTQNIYNQTLNFTSNGYVLCFANGVIEANTTAFPANVTLWASFSINGTQIAGQIPTTVVNGTEAIQITQGAAVPIGTQDLTFDVVAQVDNTTTAIGVIGLNLVARCLLPQGF